MLAALRCLVLMDSRLCGAAAIPGLSCRGTVLWQEKSMALHEQEQENLSMSVLRLPPLRPSLHWCASLHYIIDCALPESAEEWYGQTTLTEHMGQEICCQWSADNRRAVAALDQMGRAESKSLAQVCIVWSHGDCLFENTANPH